MSNCSICNDEYTEEFKIPKILPCGHTYCLICLLGVFHTQKAFVCTECNQTFRDPTMIQKLPNNYAILKCMQQLKAQKTVDFSPSSFFSQSTTPFRDMLAKTNFSPSHDLFSSSSASRQGSMSNSFNFDGFKRFVDDFGLTNSRTLQRSMTMPRKDRSRTPPIRVRDIEINEKGMFREKSPRRSVDECNIKGCTNPKMYKQGSMQPFCSFHYAQFYHTNPFEESYNSYSRSVKSQDFPQNTSYSNRTENASTVNSNFSQAKSHDNPFDMMSSQDSNQYSHRFGKPSAFDLMKFFDKAPATNKSIIPNKNVAGVANSSVFSGITTNKDNQNITFGNLNTKNTSTLMPFPKTPATCDPSQEAEMKSNKCVVPGCCNERLVYKGMTHPFCGRKCWQKWQTLPKEEPFWR